MCAAQQDDGYLDTYYIINGKDKIFTNLKDHHELYCMGHLIEGAVAYYEATGKDKLLKAAARFADYAAAHFGPEEGKCKGYPGHEIAEMALVRLYELIEDGKLDPELIIGVPVGFVNVVQSKELIMQADVPYIVARGRKGGSNVAACICNALLYMIDNNRGY